MIVYVFIKMLFWPCLFYVKENIEEHFIHVARRASTRFFLVIKSFLLLHGSLRSFSLAPNSFLYVKQHRNLMNVNLMSFSSTPMPCSVVIVRDCYSICALEFVLYKSAIFSLEFIGIYVIYDSPPPPTNIMCIPKVLCNFLHHSQHRMLEDRWIFFASEDLFFFLLNVTSAYFLDA